LDEIIRIHSGKGKLLIADFNAVGFYVMDKLHTTRYGKLHTRGKIQTDEYRNILQKEYFKTSEINTKLNIGFVVEKKL
jgi:hypothetical protein